MTTAEFIKKLIPMVAPAHIDELLDLSREVARPIQQEIAKHVQSVAKDSILAKTEVRDDELRGFI